MGGGSCNFLMLAGCGITKIEQVQTRGKGGSKFWSFCDNVIIESPPTTINYYPLHHCKCGGKTAEISTISINYHPQIYEFF